MPFVKGQSGNPAGRKPGTGYTDPVKKIIHDVKHLAKEASIDAINTLVEVMKDKTSPPSARVTAAQAVLDRGWGKPTQTIEATVNHVDQMGYDELREYIAREAAELGIGGAPVRSAEKRTSVRGKPH